MRQLPGSLHTLGGTEGAIQGGGVLLQDTFVSYDYEPIHAMGTMLGMKSGAHPLELLDLIEVYGLDAMSTRVALAWMTEAFEKGIITEKETGHRREITPVT